VEGSTFDDAIVSVRYLVDDVDASRAYR